MPHPEQPDERDVRLSLQGELDAFGRLFDRHARSVRAVVAAVSNDFGTVEDQTQETFLRGCRRLASLRDPARFGPWIQGVARQVARERRRQLGRDRVRFHVGEIEPTAGCEFAAAVEDQEEQRRVLVEVAELPERERLALHAYYFHEQRATQAAEDLGVSRSGFYLLLQRAIDMLRKRLGVAPHEAKASTKK